jgi:hypothetical protein
LLLILSAVVWVLPRRQSGVEQTKENPKEQHNNCYSDDCSDDCISTVLHSAKYEPIPLASKIGNGFPRLTESGQRRSVAS